jgi:hypothetical protein
MKAGKLTPDQKFWIAAIALTLFLTALLLIAEKGSH